MGKEIEKAGKEESGKRLSPNQRAAVVLESNGYKRNEVAKALGLTTGTIKSWHDNPDFMRELEKTSRDVDKQLEPVIEVLRVRLGTSMLKAQEVLEEALEARTADGKPYWSVRMAAVRTLLDSYKIVEPPKDKDDDGPKVGTLVINATPEVAKQMLETAQQNERRTEETLIVEAEEVSFGE